MKITCLKENIKKIINIIEKASSQNPTLPILKNFLLKKEKDRLYFIATDLELAVKSWMDIKTESDEKIETTVPISVFSNFINNLFEEKINLDIEKNHITIQTPNLKTKIQCIEAEDFPIIPKVKKEGSFEIDAEILKNSFEAVMSASSTSLSRPEISGILLNLSKEEIVLAATDSFRLAQKTIPAKFFKTQKNEGVKILIPLKAVYEFIRIVNIVSPGKYIEVIFDQNQILFDFYQTQLISRLINASFPEYQEIIPSRFNTKVIIEKDKLISAVKLSSVFSSQINDVKIRIPDNLKNVEITTQDASIGENKVFLDGDIEGDGIEIAFNYKYLLDGVKPIRGEKIFIGLNENNTPTLIRDKDDKSYIYTLMPIKI